MLRDLFLFLFGVGGFTIAGFVVGFLVGKKFSVASVATSTGHVVLDWLKDLWTDSAAGKIPLDAATAMAAALVNAGNKQVAADVNGVKEEVKK